jgi:hypothetical protein
MAVRNLMCLLSTSELSVVRVLEITLDHRQSNQRLCPDPLKILALCNIGLKSAIAHPVVPLVTLTDCRASAVSCRSQGQPRRRWV